MQIIIIGLLILNKSLLVKAFSSDSGSFNIDILREPFHISNDDIVFKYPRDASTGSVNIGSNLDLNIFCRDAEPKLLVNFFRTAKLKIVSSSANVQVFKGTSPTEVRQNYLNRSKWLSSILLIPWGIKDVWDPFIVALVFVYMCSKSIYRQTVFSSTFSSANVGILVCGLLLFSCGYRLSRSTTLFYLLASIIGAVTFGAIILILVTRLLMKMKQSFLTIGAIWGIFLYYVGGVMNAQHFEDMLSTSLQHVLIYLAIGATFSFLICYRIGPPTHSRTLNITKWLIQALGLTLIYMSSEYVETTLTIIGLSLMFYNAKKLVANPTLCN